MAHAHRWAMSGRRLVYNDVGSRPGLFSAGPSGLGSSQIQSRDRRQLVSGVSVRGIS